MAGFSIVALMMFLPTIFLGFLIVFILFLLYSIICYFFKSAALYRMSKKRNYKFPITSWIPFYNNVNLGKLAGKPIYGWIIFICDLLAIGSIYLSAYLTYVNTYMDKIFTCVSSLSMLFVLALSIISSNLVIEKALPKASTVVCIINTFTLGIFKSIILFVVRNK